MTNCVLLAIVLIILTAPAHALTVDEELSLVIDLYNLKPESCRIDNRLIDENLIPIGEVVFNTTVLSGDSDTSCSTCHIDDKHLTDGLPISVGVGGSGEAHARIQSDGVIVARNSFTLFGRGSSQYKTFFWDGKVQELAGQIYSPIGEGYSLGFKSPLAVAAVMPLLARDEFLGRQSFIKSNNHLEKINEAYYSDKFEAANSVLSQIVLEGRDDDSKTLIDELKKADIEKPTLSVIGNSLASFIASKIRSCNPTPWERYISGELDSISKRQKQGAIIFYGKGRCAACHSGSLFSDFKFHSIGVPQGEFGTHIHRQDIGRAGVTYQVDDRYKFRTPSLVHVSKTPPYGHNGAFRTMEDVVQFHINPIPFFVNNGWTSERELLNYGKILSTRSNILGFIDISDEVEVESVIEYLNSL